MRTVIHVAQAPGGVERYLYTLLKYIDKSEYNNILVLSQNYDIQKFKNLATKIETVEMYREIGFFKEIKAIFNIRKLIKKYHPDVVYIHSSKAGVVARIANLGFKNKCIYNAHGWAFNMKISKSKKKIYTLIEKMLSPLCTKIICISDYEKQSAIKEGICRIDKLKVIYNGIDFEEHRTQSGLTRTNLGIPEEAFVVGSVGRLDRQKAPDIFVKAAKKIKEKIPNTFFVMVGNGNEQEEIIKQINEYGLSESFLITGWVNNPLDYIRCFDVAMLLSRWEGFGLVLPEYMLEGKPIIATKVDAIPNIITDGMNGLLVDMDDYSAAANAVEKIYTSNIGRTLIENGKKCVYERFNAQRLAKETEALIEQMYRAEGEL